METKTKCKALEAIEGDRKWHLGQLARLAQLETFLEVVPEEIKSLNVKLASDYSGRLSIIGYDEDTLKALKTTGIMGLRKTLSYDTNWRADGKVFLGGQEVDVIVHAVEQPPTCRLEEYTELVTKYRAICEETGEEIK